MEPTTVISVTVLRECFRNLQAFRAVYESEGVDVIIGPGGAEICLWDLEYLYEQLHLLPPRQHEAIELCLIENVKETDAAVIMGVSPTNPVAAYATAGLSNLIKMIYQGQFPRFSVEDTPSAMAS